MSNRPTGRRMPSPALLVAMIALVAALAGTAIAQTGDFNGKITKSKVKRIANKQIDKRFPIGASQIGTAAVTTDKIAAAAVTSEKIAGAAVTSEKIAGDAVTTGKIAGDAVTSGKIAGDAVTSGKIAGQAVTSGKIAGEAVTTAKIAAGAVTADKVTGSLPTGFASVTAAGTLLSSSGAVTAVNRPEEGIYCFDLSATVAGGIATLESEDSSLGDKISASTNAANAPCAGAFTDFRVDTRTDDGVSNDDAFYIAFFS